METSLARKTKVVTADAVGRRWHVTVEDADVVVVVVVGVR